MIAKTGHYTVNTITRPHHRHQVIGPPGLGVVFTASSRDDAEQVAELLNQAVGDGISNDEAAEYRETIAELEDEVEAEAQQVLDLRSQLQEATKAINELDERLRKAEAKASP
ncbi:MAG: hypothetical protein AAGC44_05330 [Planctomycetota bacterium]